MKMSRHRGFGAIGWVAAYVLALHTILSGLVALPSMAPTAAGDAAAALCLGSGHAGGAADGANGPVQSNSHCAACFMAAAGALPSPAVASHPAAYDQPAGPESRGAGLPPPADAHGRPGLPRAPPRLA